MRFFGCKYPYCLISLAIVDKQQTLNKNQTTIDTINDFCKQDGSNLDIEAALQKLEYEEADETGYCEEF